MWLYNLECKCIYAQSSADEDLCRFCCTEGFLNLETLSFVQTKTLG